jgi:FkbM family methyltransferase
MTAIEIFIRTQLRRFGVTRRLSRFATMLERNRSSAAAPIRVERLSPNQVVVYFRSNRWTFESDLAIDCEMASSSHEDSFARALFDAISQGANVWDVGANIGYYTVLLAQAVGDQGMVCAFEPNPQCLSRLPEILKRNGVSNVRLIDAALGDRNGFAPMVITPDYSVVGRIEIESSPTAAGTVPVRIMTGDSAVATEHLPIPNLIKIDVEGFEEEVILGLKKTLASDECRKVVCEVHFSILDSRGKRYAPKRIQQELRSCGFKQLSWIDRSHLLAAK